MDAQCDGGRSNQADDTCDSRRGVEKEAKNRLSSEFPTKVAKESKLTCSFGDTKTLFQYSVR